jgi:endonuclease/exonuclease/phosphatase family metal-dependent hydrolase
MRAVRVMTWNALNLNLDGHVENGTVVASWNSARKPAAAALIGPAQPDVLAVQEAGASTDGRGSSRQVDSLAQALGSDYTVAQTEIAPGHKGYAPTGNYIIYRSGEFTALNKVGATTTRGHWAIGDSMSAAYQVLRDDSTNASFLMVSVHLNSSEPSTERASEASTIVSHAGALGTQLGLPIVYAGDFDSFYASYSPDLPGAAMRASGVDEALFLATSVTDANYRTVNGYRLTPPTGKVEVDRVWVSPGVGVQTWGQLLDLAADGQFSGTIPSDHNPSYADLMIPYPGVSTSAE